MSMNYRVFETRLGWACMYGQNDLASGLMLPLESKEQILKAVGEGMPGGAVETKHDFQIIIEQLSAYFAGEKVEFDCGLDLSAGSSFDREVWEAARSIPFGETRSYGWIADKISRPNASRAVGGALGRNLIPVVVPCHRVLRTDGALGGFSAGLDWKVRLLALEGVSDK